MISPFFKGVFGVGLGEVFTFWDGDYYKGLCFWVTWEGEVWLFFKVGRLGFFLFFKKYFFGCVGWGGIFFFFFSFII
jgi:hypothetical protein